MLGSGGGGSLGARDGTRASVSPIARSETPVSSRCFVIPPRKNGKPAPSNRHVSTSVGGLDDALVEQVPDLVGERLEDGLVDLVDRARRVARERRPRHGRAAKFSSVGESGKRSG